MQENVSTPAMTGKALDAGTHVCVCVCVCVCACASQVNNAPWYGLYVIAFIFLGSWFWVNLLVSVVVEFYTKMVQEKGDVLASKQAKVSSDAHTHTHTHTHHPLHT